MLKSTQTETGTGVPDARRKAVAESIFIRACRRQKVDRTPVWLMRQAGRFMPEFREIRSKYGFLELCHNSQLAADVTVMAVDMLGVDAAIIFADILLPIEALGLGLQYLKGEGPHIENRLATPASIAALPEIDVKSSLSYVYDAITIAANQLPQNIPLIGFAGAPFTLASYMIEGGGSRNYENTKALMYTHADAWNQLMERIVKLTAEYLMHQVEAGADALQIFDSWIGCLSPCDYQRFVQPHMKALFDRLRSFNVPVIHFGTGTATLLPLMSDAGGDVIGFDWRVNLRDEWNKIGSNKAVQGNLDPTVLLGTKEEIKNQAERILREAAGQAGHVFNLGHGILPPTPVENVKYLVESVHSWEVKQ